LWPFRLLLLVSLIILSLWTALEGAKYVRRELNAETGESAGICVSNHYVWWLVPAFLLLGTVTLLVIGVAWQTKDVDEAYAESSWIFTAISTQMQVIFVSIPVLIILGGGSTNARFMGIGLLVFSWAMSLVILVMIPKFVAFYGFGNHPNNNQGGTASTVVPSTDTTNRRGSSIVGSGGGRVVVSGIRNNSSVVSGHTETSARNSETPMIHESSAHSLSSENHHDDEKDEDHHPTATTTTTTTIKVGSEDVQETHPGIGSSSTNPTEETS